MIQHFEEEPTFRLIYFGDSRRVKRLSILILPSSQAGRLELLEHRARSRRL